MPEIPIELPKQISDKYMVMENTFTRVVKDNPKDKNENKPLYVVSGFMRTGTSMMMKALEAGGLEAKYQQSRNKMKDRFADDHYDPNIGGLYELEVKDYRSPDFPIGYEGKLIKALGTGVPSMRVMKSGIRVIFMRRNAEEIRQSYQAFFNRNISINEEDFQHKMDILIESISNRKDVLSCDVLWFRDVVRSPEKYFRLLKKSGWPINVSRCVKIIDSKYIRFKKEKLVKGVL